VSAGGLDEQVVVVGGGPVGLVAALSLALRGVRSVVLEAGSGDVRSEWRGSTLHPPTMEILDHFGLAKEVVDGATRVSALQYRDTELSEYASFGYSVLESLSPFPSRWQFEQYKLLRMLRRAAEDQPAIQLLYGQTVTGLEEGADEVRLDVQTDEGPATFRAPWVVAADGAHSAVRKLLDIDFPGWTYPYQSLVIATPFPFEDHVAGLSEVAYLSGPRGRLSLIRTPDIWRGALSTDTEADEDERAYDTDSPHPSYIAAMRDLLSREHGPGEGPLELRQHQLYRSHQRVAVTFRRGRCVLVGDAAHLSSTTGGMGLNSGIHDAWELAPALATALRDGKADAVQACAERRRQVTIDVVQPTTTDARTLADAGDLESRRARIAQLRERAADEQSTRDYLRGTSMIGTVITT
jgi:3-(3-hydroxy-phenyl)propionate hydroxylase